MMVRVSQGEEIVEQEGQNLTPLIEDLKSKKLDDTVQYHRVCEAMLAQRKEVIRFHDD